MNDGQFDDILKRRLTDYEDPGFDPASLTALHLQIAANTATPWHTRYRSELITVVTIVLCTMLILGTQFYLDMRQARLLQERFNASEPEKPLGMKDTPSAGISPQHGTVYDTVRVFETQAAASDGYQLLLSRLSALERQIELLGAQPRHVFVPAASDLPGVSAQLSSAGSSTPFRQNFFDPRRPSAQPAQKASAQTTGDQALSPKMVRELEKHYQKGIGLRVGPALSSSRGVYGSGKGQNNIGYGLLADVILSPGLSIETGAHYFVRYYEVGHPHELANPDLPATIGNAGALQKAEIDNWMLDIPINVKYRYPFSVRTHGMAGAGISPHVFLKQVFEYDYAFDDGTGQGNLVTHSAYRNRSAHFYAGTLNFQIGIQHELKNEKILETTLSYQHGLRPMGIEQNTTSFLSLKGVYWFPVR